MIELTIPGRAPLRQQHLVTDVNGTIATDGILMDGLIKRIASIRDRLTVHLVTADTHGRQSTIDQQLSLTATRLAPGSEDAQKRDYVQKLGAESVVAMGQGPGVPRPGAPVEGRASVPDRGYDALMLKTAALGICILSPEGAAIESLVACDVVVPSIHAAFDLLDKPVRIVASLRK